MVSTGSVKEWFEGKVQIYCDVPRTGENVSLLKWFSELRNPYKKIQNNPTPTMKLSDENIQRLNDAGWCLRILHL